MQIDVAFPPRLDLLQTQIDFEVQRVFVNGPDKETLFALLRVVWNFSQLNRKQYAKRLLGRLVDCRDKCELSALDKIWVARWLTQVGLSCGDQSTADAELANIENFIASARDDNLYDYAVWQLFLIWQNLGDIEKMTTTLSRLHGQTLYLRCQLRLIKFHCDQGSFVAAQKHIAKIKEEGDRIVPLQWLCNTMLKHGKAENAVWAVNDLLGVASMRAVVLSSSLLHWQKVKDGELADV